MRSEKNEKIPHNCKDPKNCQHDRCPHCGNCHTHISPNMMTNCSECRKGLALNIEL